jgi:acetyl-CoA carboxylase carboxyltransferase component
VATLREEYRRDIDLEKLASELVIDGIVSADSLRDELVKRFAIYAQKKQSRAAKKHIVVPV